MRCAGSRSRNARILAVQLMFCALASCHRSPTPYRTAMRAAESARREENYEEERQAFEDAAQLANESDDADEARYRRAESFSREGRFETAAKELESFAREYPTSHRAARAWLDAGRNWERANEPRKAHDAFAVLVERYPESGGALSAATRIVELRTQLHQSSRSNEWRRLLEHNRNRELDQGLRYRYAQALEEVSIQQSLLSYEDVAKKHPLPAGTYTDEALLRAAELRLQLGDAAGAIETLELLSKQGGPAAIVGSYTRTAYVKAVFLQGMIQRDQLNRPVDAVRTFRSLKEKYPNSRLVDDALWEVVRTERLMGESGCESMDELVSTRPESRFVRCRELVCSRKPSSTSGVGECRSWLEGAERRKKQIPAAR